MTIKEVADGFFNMKTKCYIKFMFRFLSFTKASKRFDFGRQFTSLYKTVHMEIKRQVVELMNFLHEKLQGQFTMNSLKIYVV
jgi:hypothetical protein